MKCGIVQSRGLGDILIALPIARSYFNQGYEVVWPVCREFLSSVKCSVPWVTWVGIDIDNSGDFFYKTPLRVLREYGVEEDDILYLYQYLSSNPELTDVELFNILKFDQYKYWVSGVPFIEKWQLPSCIVRDSVRESALVDKLGLSGDYAVVHLSGSDVRINLDLSWIDPAVRIIDIDQYKTDSIFDWLSVLERCSIFVGIDSVFANLVDQMGMSIEKYWVRRSPWDLTPVLGGLWKIVPTDLPIREVQRVDIVAACKAKEDMRNGNAAFTQVPFAINKSGIPTSFMHALRK